MLRFVRELMIAPLKLASYLKVGLGLLNLLSRYAGVLPRTSMLLLPTLSLLSLIVLHIVRRSSAYLKTVIVLLPIVTIATLSIVAIANPYFKADLGYAHERSSATQVIDANGYWLGIIPPANFSDWSDGSILPPDHVAVPVGHIPPVWKFCMIFLEDREFDGFFSRWTGIDPLAIAKSGLQTISGQRRRGASTLYMQVVRTLQGRSPSSDEKPGDIIVRKTAELLGSTALAEIFRASNSRAAEQFIAMHLPLVIGSGGSAFGEPIHGIELASQLLFGVSADGLPPEQQAILAAAVKTPVLMAPPGDEKASRRAVQRWERVKKRADYCLRKSSAGATAESAARQRLALMQLPAPFVDPALLPLLPTDKKLAWQISVNPVRRALYFARHELRNIRHELNRAAGSGWRGRVVSVRLTTSTSRQKPFSEEVASTLKRLRTDTAGLEMALVQEDARLDTADIVIACVDPDSRVRRLYTNREGLLWHRKAPTGSTAKMTAAVVLGKATQSDTPYCVEPNRNSASHRDKAQHCGANSSWVPAREAFAQSNSKAIHWALRKFSGKDRMEEVANVLGLPAFGDVPPTTALTIGTFEMTPEQMLVHASRLGAGIGGADSNTSGIRVIDEIAIVADDGTVARQVVEARSVVNTGNLRRIFTPRVRSFVAQVLGSTSDESGTLQALHPIKIQLEGRLYAKTGTVSVAGSTRHLHILGTFMRAGKPWTFLVTIGAPNESSPLGRRLAAGQFASLAAKAICGKSEGAPTQLQASR